jgi:hypothetical protein
MLVNPRHIEGLGFQNGKMGFGDSLDAEGLTEAIVSTVR